MMEVETHTEIIKLTISIYGECVEVATYKNEYHSLMELITDKFYTEDFGECIGMGRCATCLVKINSDGKVIEGMERNEIATLNKIGISDAHVRLSCQILIDETLNGCHVSVL